jgi:hypothetical protein
MKVWQAWSGYSLQGLEEHREQRITTTDLCPFHQYFFQASATDETMEAALELSSPFQRSFLLPAPTLHADNGAYVVL